MVGNTYPAGLMSLNQSLTSDERDKQLFLCTYTCTLQATVFIGYVRKYKPFP